MQTVHHGAVPPSELHNRIGRLQQVMGAGNIDGVLVAQKTDLFYFAGTAQQGWLYVPGTGKPLLLIFKDFDRARTESPLEQVASILSPKKIPALLADYGYRLPGRLGLELDVLPANLYLAYQDIFERSEVVDVSYEIRLIRAVKSPFELELISRAAAGSDKLSAKITELLEEGKSEVAVAGELEGYARSLGHQGIVRMRMWGAELFYGHLMCGASAAVPSYLASPTGGQGVSPLVSQGAGFNLIARNQPILVDYVFALDGYISDHARIYCIGELPDEIRRAHDAMLDIQDEAKAFAKPGVSAGDLYEMMISRAEEMGHGVYFMGVGDRRIRFTGHGVGLELDEFPFIAKGQALPLEENMVIALEPKVIMPGIGVVGIENTLKVTPKGLESITKSPDAITYL